MIVGRVKVKRVVFASRGVVYVTDEGLGLLLEAVLLIAVIAANELRHLL
jgi:hypothetical protein